MLDCQHMRITSMTCGRSSHIQTVKENCSLLGTPLYSKQANLFTVFSFPFLSTVVQYSENWSHWNRISSYPNLVGSNFCHSPFLKRIRVNSGHSGSGTLGLGHNTTGRVMLTGWLNFTWQGSSFKTGDTTSSGKSVLTISRVISVSSSSAPLGTLTVQP